MSNDKSPAIPLWQLHSKREKLACLTDYARWKLGLLDKYLNPDFSRVERVIFVCMGNICRSAYAEARFNALGGASISAGTNAVTGRPADEHAMRFAKKRGIDLSSHRTMNLSEVVSCPSDLYVCMELIHAEKVVSAMGVDKANAGQILLLGGLNGFPRVSDPFGKSEAYFEDTFSRIDFSLTELLKRFTN